MDCRKLERDDREQFLALLTSLTDVAQVVDFFPVNRKEAVPYLPCAAAFSGKANP